MNVEQYVNQTKTLVAPVTEVGECKTRTKNTGSNDYGQPQTVAERCEVVVPSHIGSAGQTNINAGAERQIYVVEFYQSFLLFVTIFMITKRYEIKPIKEQ